MGHKSRVEREEVKSKPLSGALYNSGDKELNVQGITVEGQRMGRRTKS